MAAMAALKAAAGAALALVRFRGCINPGGQWNMSFTPSEDRVILDLWSQMEVLRQPQPSTYSY